MTSLLKSDSLKKELDKVLRRGVDLVEMHDGRMEAENYEEVKPSRKKLQWRILGDGRTFAACGETTERVPPGVYKFVNVDDSGIGIQTGELQTDDLIALPGSVHERVLSSIDKFWNSREPFNEFGQLYKRGILLHGPAGSGKTSIIALAARDIIARGGIVVINENIQWTISGMALIRAIEPTRPIVHIIEDIDEDASVGNGSSKRGVMSLLDGEHQIENVVHIATTNFPSTLDARISKRPSRFDEVIEVGLPGEEVRRIYLTNKTHGRLTKEEIEKWVRDTDKMSVAFLREIIVSVFCLGRSYEETLTRLNEMKKQLEDPKEYGGSGRVGFGGSAIVDGMPPPNWK